MKTSLKSIFAAEAARSTLWTAFLEYHLSPKTGPSAPAAKPAADTPVRARAG